MKDRILGFKQNVFFLGLVSLFTDFSSEMIYPILPLFMRSVLGVNMVFIGLVEGVAESTASIFKIFSGFFSDKIKKRKGLVFFGYFLSTISKPLFSAVTSGWGALAVRFSDRLGKGVRTAPRDALIADSVDADEKGKSFGFHRAMDTVGAILGPVAVFFLLPLFNNNYRLIFLISSIPAVAALFFIITFVKEKGTKTPEVSASVRFSFKSFDGNFKIFILGVVIFTLGNSSDAFLILRANLAGVTAREIPILWALFNLVYALSATPLGSLSDRLGRKKLILLGFIIYGIVYLLFGFAAKVFFIWILFVIYGLYYGMTEGVLKAYVADVVPKELYGTAYGIFNAAIGISALPASIIMGGLWHVVGIKTAFSFGAVMAAAASVIIFFVKERSSCDRSNIT